MSALKRHSTSYPGVFYIIGIRAGTLNEPEKIYYIRYRKGGKPVEEKAGWQYKDAMTPARANTIRSNRIEGDPSNQERREDEEAKRKAIISRWTVGRLWDEYKAQNPGLKGVKTDENRFKKHIAPSFANKEPKEIIPLDIDRLRLKLTKTHKPGTVRNALELLRRIVNFARKKHLCDGMPFIIEMPELDNCRTETLTPDEMSRLLKAINEDENIQAAGLMKMALFTGMRRGELFRLRWEDVDFQKGFITLVNPKGGAEQKIPLNKAARELLENHPRGGSPQVFPGRAGAQRTDVTKQINRIKGRAGLPAKFRALHGLRHVYASGLASSGKVDMYTLQKLLTHKSPQMTQRYAHLADDALKRAAEVAGNLITQVEDGGAIPLLKGKKERHSR